MDGFLSLTRTFIQISERIRIFECFDSTSLENFHQNVLEKDEEDEDIPPPSRPSNREIEESLDKLRDLSLFSTHGDEIQSLTQKLEALLDKERLQNLQQRQVTDYFVKY